MTQRSIMIGAAAAFSLAAGGALAQGFDLGEATFSYSNHDVNDTSGDEHRYSVSARTSYTFGSGFGTQFGLGYVDPGYGEGDNRGFADVHLFGETAYGLKFGLFAGYTSIDEAQFVAAAPLMTDDGAFTYGVEGILDLGTFSVSSFVGEGDGGDEISTLRFGGVGADYALSDSWELNADWTRTLMGVSGDPNDLQITDATLGVSYYAGSVMSAPMKLSATVGKSWVDFDSYGETDGVNVGVSASFTFGKSGDTSAPNNQLFDSYVLPF